MKKSVLLSIVGLVYSFWISTDVSAFLKWDEIDLDEDFLDLDLEEILQDGRSGRFERSPDYGGGLGGPLAAQSGPRAPAGPVAPRTTPAPVTAPSRNPPPPIPPIDQCYLVKVGGGDGSGKGTLRQGAINKKREFKVEKRRGKILKAIRDGEDRPNDYLALTSVFCDNDDQCLEACGKEGCNYFMSYKNRTRTNVTFLYNINEDILSKEENYVSSIGYDSTVVYSTVVSKTTSSSRNNWRNATKTNKRSKRFSAAFCSACLFPYPTFPITTYQMDFCNFCCCSDGLLNLILGLSIGLGVGVGVGVGVPLGVTSSLSTQAASAAQAAAFAQQQAQAAQFQSWTETYQVSYSSSQSQTSAQQSFQSNQQSMNQANSQNQKADDAKQGVTKFADMPFGAFAAHFFGAMVDGPIQPVPYGFIPDLPDPMHKMHWESAASGALPPIRYQGSCGACYAFTTADLIASQNAIERHRGLRDVQTQELSVQYLMDCGGSNASVGCKGGRPGLLLKNLENSEEGVPFESCYSYKEQEGQCQAKKADKCCQRQTVKFSQLIDISGPNEKKIFANILNWGPVISIVGANQQWMFYNGSGIIKARQCDPNVHNHAVIIAGYNYNDTSTTTPYYIVRNSWGTDWGINGYAKLEAGKNACGVAKYVLVTCTGDCRNVTSVKDLINRSNVPEKYKDQVNNSRFSNSSSSSHSSSSSSSSRSSSSSSSSNLHNSHDHSATQQRRQG